MERLFKNFILAVHLCSRSTYGEVERENESGCTPSLWAVSAISYPFSVTCLTASILNSSVYVRLVIFNPIILCNDFTHFYYRITELVFV